MNAKSLKTSEYHEIIAQLTEYASSQLSKRLCQNLVLSMDPTTIRQMQTETADAATRVRQKGGIFFGSPKDIRDSLKRLEVGSFLSIIELLSISPLLTIPARSKVYGYHEESEPLNDSLEDLLHPLKPLTSVNTEIRRCVISEEEVSDDASPGLCHVCRSMKVINDRMHTQLGAVLNSSRTYLQDPATTMRDGGYCLPVRSEYKNQVAGMVHDQSSTGSTLFIEPMTIIKLNNEFREPEIQEQKEIEAMLVDLSNQLLPYMKELASNQSVLVQLDFILARAALSRYYKCSESSLDTNGYISTRDGHRPLLDSQKVVPINIHLGKEFDLLIVTGPDTGGKTVSLKTVGLFTLMGQAGLHIPAFDGSEPAVFEEVFADIDDEQSIEQSLSTFPVHMINIASILEQADSHPLCLFDELGAGMDPTEDVALAIAVFTFLHNMKCRTTAITHYSELKVPALTVLGVENACCEFSVGTLQSTYRLLIGIPGKSNAFAISRKLGLPEFITDDARTHLESSDEAFEDVLTHLEESCVTIEKGQAEIQAYKVQVAQLKARLEQKEGRLDEQKEKHMREAREEAQRILREAKETVDKTIKNINKLAESSGATKQLEEERACLREELKKVNQNLFIKKKKDLKKVASLKSPHTGNSVMVFSMNLKDTAGTLPNTKGDLYVQMGILRPLVNIEDLELIEEATVGGPSLGKKRTGSSKIKMSKSSSVSPKINLIGMTTGEAVPILDRYLDDAYLAYLPQVHVVYGRGTGALKAAVHRRLKQLEYVREYRLGEYGEGDTGATIVMFHQVGSKLPTSSISSSRRTYTAEKQKVLIADDDASITELISLHLIKERYETLIVYDGEGALRVFPEFKPNIALLDLILPGIDGYRVCRELRAVSQVPVTMLSTKDEIFDKVLGLELGADDYMTKPFDSREPVARVKAVLRHYQTALAPVAPKSNQQGGYVEYPNLIVNLTNYSVIYVGHSIEMPPKELELLYFLASSPDQVFAREQLLDHIWGYEYIGDTRTVDAHIKRLWEKIKDNDSWALTTVWGIGYKPEVKR